MKNPLEELWYGNIHPSDECRDHSPETKKLMGYIGDQYDRLRDTLSDGQKELLDKLDNNFAEITDINERKIFSYAFCLGVRIAMEAMSLDFK